MLGGNNDMRGYPETWWDICIHDRVGITCIQHGIYDAFIARESGLSNLQKNIQSCESKHSYSTIY